LSIYYHKENVSVSFDEDRTSDWLESAIEELGFKCGDTSIIFCTDDYLKNINQKYLNHDYFTDIITFDYTVKDLISGDLFISVDRLKENSIQNNEKFISELYRVIIHGILHLCGYNDKTDSQRKIIRNKEDYFIRLIV
jgi:rRNA maturation RNase YbeY